MMDFLREIGVVPDNATWNKRFSMYPLLNPKAIRAEYLASFALEWDDDGPSLPIEWVSMIAKECSGTPERKMLKSATVD
jgi:hypothetical protein